MNDQQAECVDGYAAAERQIFGPYDAGSGLMLHADPLAAELDLEAALDFKLGEVVAALKGPWSPEKYAAAKAAEVATRQVFHLVSYDPQSGGGARLEDALRLFKDFLLWTAALKKNGAAAPASPSPDSGASYPEVLMEVFPTSVSPP